MSDLPKDEAPDRKAELAIPADDSAALRDLDEAAESADAGDHEAKPQGEKSAPASAAPASSIDQPAPPFSQAGHAARCFLALNFPLATTRKIAEEIAALKAPVAAAGLKVRWVPAANLHLTLKFLGSVRLTAIEAIQARLANGLRGLAPFEVEARGLGAFPSVAQPKILWVGVREDAALLALQQKVELWMEELGFPRESRAYHPHVTIGRVDDRGAESASGDLSALFSERSGRGFGTGRAGEVVIYESRTLARGAEYHALGRAALSP